MNITKQASKNNILIVFLAFLVSSIFILYPCKTLFNIELIMILVGFFINNIRYILFSMVSGFLFSEVLYRTINKIKYGYHNLAFNESSTSSHEIAFLMSLPILLVAIALFVGSFFKEKA